MSPQFENVKFVRIQKRILSWSHYERLLQVTDIKARKWYEKEAIEQVWSVRTLRRNISTQYYDRMLLSKDKQGLEEEMQIKTSPYQNKYELTHQDVGQMDMYVRMYDELYKPESDNPTLGIVLCSETDEDIAKYSVMNGNEQLFASKYKLCLPTEEQLRAEIESQKTIFYMQHPELEENTDD